MGRILFDTATSINGWIADENNSLDDGLFPSTATRSHSRSRRSLSPKAPLFPRRVESDRLRLVSAGKVGQFARIVYAIRRDTTEAAGG